MKSRIKDKRLFKSIEKKLLVIVCLLLIISTSITMYVVTNLTEKEQYKEITETFKSDVRGISTTIEYLLKTEAAELNGYVYDDMIIKFLTSDLNELKNGKADLILTQNKISNIFSANLSDKHIQNEFLVNKDGIVISTTSEEALYKDVSSEDYFKNVVSGEGVYYSEVIQSKSSSNYINVISRRVTDFKGNFVGVMCREIDSNILKDILIPYNKEGFTVSLTDKKGQVIYDENSEIIGKVTGIKELDEHEPIKNGDIISISYKVEGKDKVSMAGVVSNTNWSVYSSAYLKDIKAPINRIIFIAYSVAVGILIISLIATYIAAKKFTLPIKRLTSHMEEISKGNLSLSISNVNTGDELESLANTINKTTEGLSKALRDIQGSIDNVNDQSQSLLAVNEEVTASNKEILEAMNSISQSTFEAATQAQECTSYTRGLEESINNLEIKNVSMSNQSKDVVKSLEDSSSKIDSLIISKGVSTESFNELKSTIDELIAGIKDISAFLEVISRIATQTNLLSLNAAIEAARAGESGRGFAVVSDEIRNLSSETQQATENINGIILSIDVLVDNTRKTLFNTEKMSLEEGENFTHMEGAFSNMKNVLNKMVSTTKEIYKDINLVKDNKEQVLLAISEVASSAEQIAAITEEVNASISEQQTTFETISLSAEELQFTAESVKGSIDVFKTK